MSTDVTVVTTSGHEYAGALLLTNSTLYIANLAVDAVQQTLQIQDTELQKHDNDNRMITVTSVISHNFPDIVSDSLPTGDRERLEQFLRDAQAYARESHSDGNGEESPAGPVFTSKFALMVDPIVRDAVLSLFKNLKYNLMIDAVQIQWSCDNSETGKLTAPSTYKDGKNIYNPRKKFMGQMHFFRLLQFDLPKPHATPKYSV